MCIVLLDLLQTGHFVSDCRIMAVNGAALVEERAGITFGVELYVPWDAPEAVVDISSKGALEKRSGCDRTCRSS